ncbi:MAG: cytochrome c biogenesis protein CcsA [Acidobacteria bacterium]|nr:cytochrome c biogenesis protein CcsA [Acidobacteriota bacterium]
MPAGAHPWSARLLAVAFVLYAVAWLAAWITPRRARWIAAAGALAHLLAMFGRGWAIGFFPLTNRMESFSTAALALALVAVATWRPSPWFALPMLALTLAALGAALRFPLDLAFPPPLMRTVWYPIHVPLAFLAYALWAAAATAGLAWSVRREPDWLRCLDRWALWGFGLWSLSMIAGGVWGVLAWGAYFLWDPKVMWSVILWFHWGAFVHLRWTPSLIGRPWLRPALAGVGFLFVLVAYVGTSFLFGRSSHAF